MSPGASASAVPAPADLLEKQRKTLARTATFLRIVASLHVGQLTMCVFVLVFFESPVMVLAAAISLLTATWLFVCANRIELGSLGWSVTVLVFFAIGSVGAVLWYHKLWVALGQGSGKALALSLVVLDAVSRILGIFFSVQATRACLAIRRQGGGFPAQIPGAASGLLSISLDPRPHQQEKATLKRAARVTRVLGYLFTLGFVYWTLGWALLLTDGRVAEAVDRLPFVLLSLAVPVFIILCASRIEDGSLGWSVAVLVFWIVTSLLLLGASLSAGISDLSVALAVEGAFRTLGLVFAIIAIRASSALRRS